MSLPGLTKEQVDQYNRDGYLAIPDFGGNVYASLLARSKEIVDSFDPATNPKTQFNTSEDKNHIGDQYFLESGDKVRYFLEPDALDAKGGLKPNVSSWTGAINKIGHGLHFHGIRLQFNRQNHSFTISLVLRDLLLIPWASGIHVFFKAW